MAHYKSEVRDGMRIDWDGPIRMKDGVTLRPDVFRPVEAGLYPVIMTHGPDLELVMDPNRWVNALGSELD